MAVPVRVGIMGFMDTTQQDDRSRDPLLTQPEVQTMLRCGRSWLIKQTSAGLIRSIRVGKYLRYRTSDVERFLDEHTRGAGTAA